MADDQQGQDSRPDTQQQETPNPPPPARGAEDGTDWKAEARKWEQRAKDNAAAASRLQQIEDASKSEAQRAAEAQAAAETRAAEAEARVLRREVALDPAGDGTAAALSREDAALLDAITDEAAMRALAARLATPVPARHGNSAPLEGATPKQPADDARRAFVRSLTGRD